MTTRFTSLRTALLVPFVGLILALAATVAALVYWTGQRTIASFSEQILDDISYRVSKTLAERLQSSQDALSVVAPDAATVLPGASGDIATIAPLTMAAIEQRMWLATGVFSDASSYIYYGTADGRFIGVNRAESGTEVREKIAADAQRIAYRSSGPGMRGDELRRDEFQPSSRPWFKTAMEKNGLAWSPIYVAATSRALTVTLAKPVRNDRGALEGVLATDIPLTSLSQFMRSLKISERGVAFIVDSRGEMVATSTSDVLVNDAQGKPNRVRADASANELIRSAYAAMVTRQGNATASAGELQSTFSSSIGEVDFIAAKASAMTGLDWAMLVVIPRSDHTGPLRETLLRTAAAALTAILLAIAFGLWLTQRISRDVTRLSEATQLLASGELPLIDVKRRDEIGRIAQSMRTLSKGLLTDPLTGALNRSTFEQRFQSQFAQVKSGEALCGAIVFMDFNGFKAVNDTLGHTMGDALLAVTAQRIESALRDGDAIARYGGDEFVLMLKAESREEIDATIARCRAQLASPIVVAGQKLHAQAAFGAAMIPADGVQLHGLIAIADQRMYAEKRGDLNPNSQSSPTA